MPPSLPTAALGTQNDWAKKLESGRARSARQIGATQTLQMRPPTERDDASQGTEGGGDGGSPRLAAAAGKAAGAARTVGKVASTVGGAQGKAAGKVLQQGAEALDQAQQALQEMSAEGIAREGLAHFKTFVLWPAVGINIVIEPLSAFSLTFVAMQIYWIASMFGSKLAKPMPLWEHVLMVVLTIAQAIFFLIMLASLMIAFCMVSPSCQWDVIKNAIIPNVI